MARSILLVASTRILTELLSTLYSAGTNVVVLVWDLALTLYNAVAPLRPATRVVPDGCPGAGGHWPLYVPPTETDSRCSCPALNAMANHGVLPHSGRGISFRDLNAKIRTMYNFSPTFCFFVPNFAAQMLNKNYWTDTFDLSDLNVHNGIEHDASLTRLDTVRDSNQGKPSIPLIEELLASGTGPGGNLTPADLSRISGKRRTESRKSNGQFSLSNFHKLFGSSNSSTLLTIFGGRVDDLRPILLEERIPEGWQPRVLHPFGLTLTTFQSTVLRVELGIEEEVEDALNLFGSGGRKTA